MNQIRKSWLFFVSVMGSVENGYSMKSRLIKMGKTVYPIRKCTRAIDTGSVDGV
jgi:hypothetical protein